MRWPAETLGVYISVPFCQAKCSFCNFASGVGTPEALDRYVALLCREIRDVRSAAAEAGLALPERVDTVYLGGERRVCSTRDSWRQSLPRCAMGSVCRTGRR